MQTEFVKSLNCNYERILLEEKPEEKRYQYCMIGRGGIKGLLSCSLRYVNGQGYLYYDITSKQNVQQIYSKKNITRDWLKDFLWSFRQVRQELERFLLDAENLLLFPEQIFQDLDSRVFSFIYVPYHQGKNGIKELMDFWVEHIDYDDDLLVTCVYHMYEQMDLNGDVYLQAQIFEDVKALETAQTTEAVRAIVQTTTQTTEVREAEVRTTKLKEAAAGSAEAVEVFRSLTDGKEVQTAEAGGVTDFGRAAGDRMGTNQPRKRFFGIFDAKKKDREVREQYRRDVQDVTCGHAVAEDSAYGEDYGRTIYIEEPAAEKEMQKKLETTKGKLVAVVKCPVMTLGKKRGEADVVLEDASVSRLHARIIKEQDVFYLEDLNSTNGTFKNGLQLQPYEKRELEEGDEVKLGRVTLIFK